MPIVPRHSARAGLCGSGCSNSINLLHPEVLTFFQTKRVAALVSVAW